jgi:hypothetical protein
LRTQLKNMKAQGSSVRRGIKEDSMNFTYYTLRISGMGVSAYIRYAYMRYIIIHYICIYTRADPQVTDLY